MGNRDSLALQFPAGRGSYTKSRTNDWCDNSELAGKLEKVVEAPERNRQHPKVLESLNGAPHQHGRHAVLVLLVVSILSVMLGLSLGQTINGRIVATLSDNTTQRTQELYLWGQTVEVDGVEHEVTSYLAKELNADDIKMNLK